MTKTTMSIAEAAKYLGVSPNTLYVAVRQGEIPHFKVRSRILLRLENLNSWISAAEEASVKNAGKRNDGLEERSAAQ